MTSSLFRFVAAAARQSLFCVECSGINSCVHKSRPSQRQSEWVDVEDISCIIKEKQLTCHNDLSSLQKIVIHVMYRQTERKGMKRAVYTGI